MSHHELEDDELDLAIVVFEGQTYSVGIEGNHMVTFPDGSSESLYKVTVICRYSINQAIAAFAIGT